MDGEESSTIQALGSAALLCFPSVFLYVLSQGRMRWLLLFANRRVLNPGRSEVKLGVVRSPEVRKESSLDISEKGLRNQEQSRIS